MANTIYERARFNRRKQKDDETVEEFIADLHRLAKHCGYRTLQDELVCDRIVVGIKDREVSEKLQMKEKLTLNDAMTIAIQSEAVKTQQPVVRGEATVAVEAILSRSRSKPAYAPAQRKMGNVTTGPAPRPQKCTRCGKLPPYGCQHCQANDAVCRRCHKGGHYRRCCKTKVTIEEIAEDSEEEAFLGTVSANAVGANAPWLVKAKLNGADIEFKVDTGADVTVIPEQLYSTARDGELQPS